jgi:hypothetical protein
MTKPGVLDLLLGSIMSLYPDSSETNADSTHGTKKCGNYIFLSSRNWFLARTLINPYFDREFGIKSFVEGAKAGF